MIFHSGSRPSIGRRQDLSSMSVTDDGFSLNAGHVEWKQEGKSYV